MEGNFTKYKQIHDITKEYPEMYKVIKYFNPLFIKSNYEKIPKNIVIKKDRNNEDNIQRSVRRTKSVIKDYVLSNDFDWFVTFTFNPKKVNRYDFNHCSIKMQSWLARTSLFARENKINFKYLIVPEFHKDGAIHFHALISDYPKSMKKTKVIQDNKLVYNLPSFRYGFTNAKKIKDNSDPIFGYLTKYITKDMILVHNRRRYWCSKNLNKPKIFHNQISELDLLNKLNDDTLEYTNQYSQIYNVPKFD